MLHFLVDQALVERIDKCKDRRSEATGITWARADMMRALLTYALDRDDAEDAPAKRKGAKS